VGTRVEPRRVGRGLLVAAVHHRRPLVEKGGLAAGTR
jgi:hypothetical protein